MVLVASVCQSVVCILIPTALYSKILSAPKLQKGPSRLRASNNQEVSAANSANPITPLDILLRQFATANWRANSSPSNGAEPSVVQSPSWVLYTQRPSIKIYGEGSEYRFPPFLEIILQRIQSFFSVYKYEDTSRPRPGSFIHEVEFIQPTQVTVHEEPELEREDQDAENASSIDKDAVVIESAYADPDDILDHGTGTISGKARS